RRRLPGAEIVVFTAYPDLWAPGLWPPEAATGADRAVPYARYADLIAVLRGEGPEGGFDLAALVDFEKPDLAVAVAWQGTVERYLEIALGVGEAVCLDAEARWLHRHEAAPGSSRNHYARLERLLAWLGGAERGVPTGASLRRQPRRSRTAVLVAP